jgi:GH24 family phage-related lysozyme (muramidase)
MSFDREKLREELIRDEGVKFEIYNDHLGYPTFGIGHLVTVADIQEYGQPVGTAVTEDRCWEVFDEDVELFVNEVKKVYPHIETYPDTAQRVLINMCFNMGAPRLGKFQNMKKAIDEGNWKQAAIEGRDSRWHKQVPNRAERLMVALESI